MAVSISLSIAQNSQNVANNTSNVTVTVKASWTGGSFNAQTNASGTPQAHGTVTIDGTKYSFTSTFNTGRTTTGSQTIFTKTLNITHANDGKKTLSCSASYVTGVSSGTVSCSGTKVLTTIPRKSSLSVGNGTLGTSLTLTVTKQATSFTHTITYKCGSASGTVCTKSSSTSVAWNTSNGNTLALSSQNTTGTSLSVTFTITTYIGDTNVGSNTKTITMSIPSSVKPSCSITVSDPTGISSIYGNFVQGLSTFKVSVTTTLAYGSAITSYDITANGNKYASSNFTTDILKTSGSLTISATVKDKRGRSGTASVPKTVLAYSRPSLSKFTVNRCDQDGTDNEQGEYAKVVFNASITSLNNLNTAAYTLRYKKSSINSYTTITLSNYSGKYSVTDGIYIFEADSGSSYDIELTVADKHVSTIRTTTLSTGFVLMHWNTAGNGMGIGKMAEIQYLLDLGMQTRFFGGILHPVLEPDTDLNDVRTPNTYVGVNVSTYNYANCPLTTGTFTLEVVGMGDSGQVKQRLTSCHKTQSRAWERIYYESAWGNWICVSDFDGHLLWDGRTLTSGGYWMQASHKVTLSEPISKQKSGIVLVFSEYSDGTYINGSFHCRFVPKMMVSLHSGSAQCIQLTTSNLAYFSTKYLYINDTTISGHDNNIIENTVSSSGITLNNKRFILRYVIGV